MSKYLALSSVALITCLSPLSAWAQEAGPHQVRAAAWLELADQEAKLLNAVLLAKVFDVDLAKTLADDLRRVVGAAKSSVFRASTLAEESHPKASPELKKLEEAVRRCEQAAEKLEADLQNETKGLKEDEESEEIAPAAGTAPKAPKSPGWGVLKDALGALYQDISAARGAVSRAGKLLSPPALKAPPAPKAKKG